MDVKSLDVVTVCQNFTGNKCHSGPNVQGTIRAGQNVTRTFRGRTLRQGTRNYAECTMYIHLYIVGEGGQVNVCVMVQTGKGGDREKVGNDFEVF